MKKANYQLFPLYFQLTGGKSISDALLAFDQLHISGPEDGDRYFEAFGVGNTPTVINRPYERFLCYEFLLKQIQVKDINKFKTIHKGTPYYFLAWTAFDINHFSKAIFYLDSALAEDIRKSNASKRKEKIKEALNNPGGNFWKLKAEGPASRIITDLRNKVVDLFNWFNKETSIQITPETFADKFVIKLLLTDEKNRSLISGLFAFISEFDGNLQMYEIRSNEKLSIEPIIIHLFKGALIFETLLKLVYPKDDRGRQIKTLGGLKNNQSYKNKKKGYPDLSGLSAKSFKQLISNINRAKNPFSLNISYKNTTKIRNMSGHDLRWDDVFQRSDNYKILYYQIISAILHFINMEFK